jgi:hypothetical protein
MSTAVPKPDPLPVPPAEVPAGAAPAERRELEALAAAEAVQEARERVLLQMPVDVRSAALVVLAVLGCIVALHWAQAVFIPLMLSLIATYALAPVVDRLVRWHLPRALAAALILLSIGGAFGWTGYSLYGSAAELVDSLPVAAQKLRLAVSRGPRCRRLPLSSSRPRRPHPPRAAACSASSSSARLSMCATTCGAAPSAS